MKEFVASRSIERLPVGVPIPANTDAAVEAEAMRQQHIGSFRAFPASLAFATFLEARLTALKAENPKLIAFYNNLDTRQKDRFDGWT
jgi:hypothetical protein